MLEYKETHEERRAPQISLLQGICRWGNQKSMAGGEGREDGAAHERLVYSGSRLSSEELV